jgi:hypothetical protein
VQRGGGACYQRPGLLVAGYYDTADRFNEHLPDFEHLLERISFEAGSLMQDDVPPAATAVASPADAGVPAPPSR